jgi:hypothetical protein
MMSTALLKNAQSTASVLTLGKRLRMIWKRFAAFTVMVGKGVGTGMVSPRKEQDYQTQPFGISQSMGDVCRATGFSAWTCPTTRKSYTKSFRPKEDLSLKNFPQNVFQDANKARPVTERVTASRKAVVGRDLALQAKTGRSSETKGCMNKRDVVPVR